MDSALLGDLMSGLLDTSIGGFVVAPVRTYVSHNAPAWDCKDQLTVHCTGVSNTSDENKCALHFSIGFYVTYIDCVTGISDDGRIPSATVLENEALALSEKGWKLLYHLAQARFDGDLFGNEYDIGCANVSLGSLQVLGPQGGYAGWGLALQLELT